MMRGGLWVYACLFLAVALAVKSLAVQSVRAELAQARAEVAGLQEWARVQQRELVAARAAGALDMELQQGVGADAPLSDYAVRGAGRVWGP